MQHFNVISKITLYISFIVTWWYFCHIQQFKAEIPHTVSKAESQNTEAGSGQLSALFPHKKLSHINEEN